MYNNFDPIWQKAFRFILKNKIYFSIFLIVLIGGIYLLGNMSGSKVNDAPFLKLEKDMEEKAYAYIDKNNLYLKDNERIYISFTELNYKIDDALKCEDNGGVAITKYFDEFEYEFFYLCKERNSTSIETIKKMNEKNAKYISLKGDNPVIIENASSYNDLGYTSKTGSVTMQGEVKNEKGVYYIRYLLETGGKIYTATRIVIVKDINSEYVIAPKPVSKAEPVLQLKGDATVTLIVGQKYFEEGFTANDEIDGDITDSVYRTGYIDTTTPGTYAVTYWAENSGGIKVSLNRVVNVIGVELPILELRGNMVMRMEKGKVYEEPGYSAKDDIDGDITKNVVVTGTVLENEIGVYQINYRVVNSMNKSISIMRTVIIEEVNNSYSYQRTIDKKTPTNTEVTIGINAVGEGYSHVVLPNGVSNAATMIKYPVSANGTYTFKIYGKDGTSKTEEVTINNIDRTAPTGKCELKTGGNVTVTANDENGIRGYVYKTGASVLQETTNSNYSYGRNIDNVEVTIYDNAGNFLTTSCAYDDKMEVHFVSVGREDGIIIRTMGTVIVIDGGTDSSGKKMVDYLKGLGITKIDALIGSHLHYNHVQAHGRILSNFEVDKLYYDANPANCVSNKTCVANDVKYMLDEIKKQSKTVTIMKPDDIISIGSIKIECIGPLDRRFLDKSKGTYAKYAQNYNSLNFILNFGQTRFLFTGDHVAGSAAMKRYGKEDTLIDLKVDVYKPPHHGEETVDTNFLKKINPSYTIVTNKSGDTFPNKSTLNNLNSKIYYAGSNNVLVTSDGKNIAVKEKVKASDYKR